jgi:hypothetical protein
MKYSRIKKFKIGDLVECKYSNLGKLGIIVEIGLDYPDNGNRRSTYVEIKWSGGFKDRIYACYEAWDNVSVIPSS